MFLFYWTSENHDFAFAQRCQCKAAFCRANVGQPPEFLPQASDFHAQTCTMRFVDESRSEGSGEKHVPWHVAGMGSA